ncbi:MAG TPA: hypothetical protein VNN79_05140 [Actinomycetota bacterium]|nr:hypothetical protein [Actinomycetota bacterium]
MAREHPRRAPPRARLGTRDGSARSAPAGAQTAESNPATGLIVDSASTAKEYLPGAKFCLSAIRQ